MPTALHSRLRFGFRPPDRRQHQQRREQLQQRRVLQVRQLRQHELLCQQQQREFQRQQWQQHQQVLQLLQQIHQHELLQRHQQHPELEVVLPVTPSDSRIRKPELTDHQQYVGDEEGRRGGAPPALKLAVDKLKTVEIKTDTKNYNCVICLEGVSVGEFVKEMPCGHDFHAHCIASWLGQTNSCPVCRFKLPTDDQDYEDKKEKTSV